VTSFNTRLSIVISWSNKSPLCTKQWTFGNRLALIGKYLQHNLHLCRNRHSRNVQFIVTSIMGSELVEYNLAILGIQRSFQYLILICPHGHKTILEQTRTKAYEAVLNEKLHQADLNNHCIKGMNSKISALYIYIYIYIYMRPDEVNDFYQFT
jgi:hypothetical protein